MFWLWLLFGMSIVVVVYSVFRATDMIVSAALYVFSFLAIPIFIVLAIIAIITLAPILGISLFF